ncbi:MAG: 16S rRNA (cytosine(1402)-N(4))-methyltransferase RsmH [Tenericutes bacterium]|nr:16S rRNA (cytosine(1402)-N(4))-methyltransferase RsmH [Mycoplasmatota bacterium]
MLMHRSVLLDETIENLNIREDGIYIDCTLGYGGHGEAILKRIKRGWLFAFDKDIDAIKFSNERLSKISNNFELINTSFSLLKDEMYQRNIDKVDGIIFDLGVSSPQIDVVERGFSYMNDYRLDMRMDKNQSLDAHYVVNNYSYEKLIDIFFNYGEERYSKNIAKKICDYRDKKSIETTLELVKIINKSIPKESKDTVKRIFQAIRIEVNNELNEIERAIEDSINMLKTHGRLCVITFHSLEDKIVKKIFKKYSEVNKIVKGLPEIPDEYKPIIKIIDRIYPSKEELSNNSRSKSSTLRIIERL